MMVVVVMMVVVLSGLFVGVKAGAFGENMGVLEGVHSGVVGSTHTASAPCTSHLPVVDLLVICALGVSAEAIAGLDATGVDGMAYPG